MTAGKEKLQKPAVVDLCPFWPDSGSGDLTIWEIEAGIQVSNDAFSIDGAALLLAWAGCADWHGNLPRSGKNTQSLKRVIPAVIMGLGVMYMAVPAPLCQR